MAEVSAGSVELEVVNVCSAIANAWSCSIGTCWVNVDAAAVGEGPVGDWLKSCPCSSAANVAIVGVGDGGEGVVVDGCCGV